MKLRLPLFAILAVVSSHSLAAGTRPGPAINASPVAAGTATSESPAPLFYVDFGEFMYRVVSLEMSSRGDPIDINNLSIDFIYGEDVDVWFDFVLAQL